MVDTRALGQAAHALYRLKKRAALEAHQGLAEHAPQMMNVAAQRRVRIFHAAELVCICRAASGIKPQLEKFGEVVGEHRHRQGGKVENLYDRLDHRAVAEVRAMLVVRSEMW